MPGTWNSWLPSCTLTPASESMSRVISAYGRDFRLPLITILVSFSASGAAMSSAERNCELTPPSRCAVPPRIFPFITSGALPLPRMEKAVAPRSHSELRSGPLGLVRIEASPVSTAPSVRAATAEQKRRVVPEFRTLITSSGVFGLSETPDIVTSPFCATFAPKASLADMVALVSADMRGLFTVPPGPSDVIKMAR
ncbi:Uncharacterised protein [uncultured archaeon]|nr:Uncharacterised protein [uncultured archaeon]